MPLVFTYPLALVGLAAVPALVAIYFLRHRFQRRPVSSLMLWVDPREPRDGGTHLRRLRTPLLFFLELLAIALLSLGAADPQVRSPRSARPLVVVLDDSFSMQAGGADSPRDRALRALREEWRRNTPYSIRFVLAGRRPQALGEPARAWGEAEAALGGWRCRAPALSLEDALGRAAELGGELALLLVVTDRPPPDGLVPQRGRVRWWAFGAARPNVAFVNAARGAREGGDRCLLEVANLGPDARTAALAVEVGDRPLRRSALELGPWETRQVVLRLAEGAGPLRARLGDDELSVDNEVTLLPAARRAVRVRVRLEDEVLRGLVERGVRATGAATLADADPDLVFTDREEGADAEGDAWVVLLPREKEAAAYTGPFVLDRRHPLTEGLSLRGVAWGGGKSEALDGSPVVMAGNVPLLTDAEVAAGGGPRHVLRWRFRPDLSTLQDTPDWPALLWNLLHWRAAHLPGVARPNVRAGEAVEVSFPSARAAAELRGPDGASRPLPVSGRRLAAPAEEAGVYEVVSGEEKYTFAANALARDESDLSGAASGRWGGGVDAGALRLEYRAVGWLLLLAALGALTAHLLLVARAGRAGR